MVKINFSKSAVDLYLSWPRLKLREIFVLSGVLAAISVFSFLIFYINGLGLAYNDARSHLDIGRRVVENLQPGLAQLGSVWLPLPHILMMPTIWNDFMWHSGLAGTIPSMISFVATGVLIYLYLKELRVGLFGRVLGVFIFATNLNILYLQSTAMTELLLLATMTAGVYELLLWYKNNLTINLIQAAFWIMLSTLVRYDGWFLLLVSVLLIILNFLRKFGWKRQPLEGTLVLFLTLGALGIALWFFWNLLIFKDPLYFLFGPYSAYAQQKVLEGAGNLVTKGHMLLSAKFYFFAMCYTVGTFFVILGFVGAFLLLRDRKIQTDLKIAVLALFAPLLFNIVALYLGHSVLYIQGLTGSTWFNIRYGAMMIPSFAIFIGFLFERLKQLRPVVLGLVAFITFFALVNVDAATIDDARAGASQKNVSEVASYLKQNAAGQSGFILISAASHDAIIFSSGLPMSRFIHEGTGHYWKNAIADPAHWARWIIMRTNDPLDLTFREIRNNPEYADYELVGKYPFADIYQLKPQFRPELASR